MTKMLGIGGSVALAIKEESAILEIFLALVLIHTTVIQATLANVIAPFTKIVYRSKSHHLQEKFQKWK